MGHAGRMVISTLLEPADVDDCRSADRGPGLDPTVALSTLGYAHFYENSAIHLDVRTFQLRPFRFR